MPEINLPDVSIPWSSSGDILKPADAKIAQGWQTEIPPRQWFNWLDNRQDEAIAHIAQHGIAVWSPTLEYQANKSYVQGSDGIVYRSTNTHVNINPVGDSSGTWQSAFLRADQALSIATAAQSRAMTDNTVALSPLQLANAFTGTNRNFGATTGFQVFPGGFTVQWMKNIVVSGGQGTFTLPKPLTTQIFGVVVTDNTTSTSGTVYQGWDSTLNSLTQVRIISSTTAADELSILVFGY